MWPKARGMPAATFAAAESQKIAVGDEVRYFPVEASADRQTGMRAFHGEWRLFRLWSRARTHQQIHDNRYVQLDPTGEMLLQFGAQEIDSVSGLAGGDLVDSSQNRNYARYGFPFAAGVNEDATQWINKSAESRLASPVEGRTFPLSSLIYAQNDPDEDGYNPNEEQAFLVGGVVHAMRCDLNKTAANAIDFTSLPYVLVQYADPEVEGHVQMAALRVVAENDMYRFRSFLDAGLMFQSPSPLNRFQPANLHKFVSGPLYADTGECFKDRKGWYWAHQAGDDGGSADYAFEFSYPYQAQFDSTAEVEPEPGAEVGWMADYTGRDDSYLTTWGVTRQSAPTVFIQRDTSSDPANTPIDWTFIVNWPKDVKGLYVNDTLIDAKKGLPAIAGQLSVKVAYQQSMATAEKPSVRLIDPTRLRYGSLKVIPDDIKNYREEYKIEPDMVGASVYDAFQVLFEAMKNVGTDTQKMKEYIAGMKNFDTVTGTLLYYNAEGSAVKPIQVQLVTKGEYHYFGVVDDAQIIDPANY